MCMYKIYYKALTHEIMETNESPDEPSTSPAESVT